MSTTFVTIPDYRHKDHQRRSPSGSSDRDPKPRSDCLDCSNYSSIISNASADQSPRNHTTFEEQQHRQHQQQTYYAVDTVSQAAAMIMSHYDHSSKPTNHNMKQQSAASRLLAPSSPQSVRRSLDILLDASSVSSSSGRPSLDELLGNWPQHPTDDGQCPSTTITSNISTKSSSTGGGGGGVSARSNTRTAGVASSLVDTSSLFQAGAGGGRSTKLPTLSSAPLNNADYYKYIRDGDADDKDCDCFDPALHDTFGGMMVPAAGGPWQMPPSPKLAAVDLHQACASASGHSTSLLASSPGLTINTLCGDQSSSHQPSVTLRGYHLTSVPPLHVLARRKQTREALFLADSPATTTTGSAAAKQQQQSIHPLYTSSLYKSTSTTNYISEAKKVLGAAMKSLPSHEAGAAKGDVSSSGAIGPLIRFLQTNANNDASTAVIAPTVHTLTLLVSNAPNREVVVGLQGLHALLAVLRSPEQQKKEGIAVREDVLQLLWDLDGGRRKAPLQVEKDVLPLLGVLRDSERPVTAHQALHFLSVCLLTTEDANSEVQEVLRTAAHQLVREIVAHNHRLQDAAQYALGTLLAKLLGDRSLVSLDLVNIHIRALLLELKRCSIVGGSSGEEEERNDAISQGQLLLTVLSVMAGNGRLRAALAEGHARWVVAAFGQRATVEGLKTRALSLCQVLQKEEMMHASDVWYFGREDI